MELVEARLLAGTQELQAREQQLDAREIKLMHREKLVMEKEQQMGISTRLPTFVRVSIGGARMIVTTAVLMKFKDSYFGSRLLAESGELLGNGIMHIDRDLQLFKLVITFLKTGKVKPLDEETTNKMKEEFLFYNLPFPELQTYSAPSQGILLAGYQDTFAQWLPDKNYELIYKASQNGFAAIDFHKTCDNKGATLTTIQSKEGYLFGGFSPSSWDSSNGFKTHPDAFLFTLSNPHGIPPTKYSLLQGDPYAIHCVEACGPVFGLGSDMMVRGGTDACQSVINFPCSFVDTTLKASNTFTGHKYSTIKEVEVYK